MLLPIVWVLYRYGNLKYGKVISWLTKSISLSGYCGLNDKNDNPLNTEASSSFLVKILFTPGIDNNSPAILAKLIV